MGIGEEVRAAGTLESIGLGRARQLSSDSREALAVTARREAACSAIADTRVSRGLSVLYFLDCVVLPFDDRSDALNGPRRVLDVFERRDDDDDGKHVVLNRIEASLLGACPL